MSKRQLNLIFALALWILGGDLIAAEITEINPKRRVITINKGKVDGFTKKEEVCFYEVSGKVVGCGQVKRSELYSASIKVSAELVKKINKSQSARLKRGPEALALQPPTFALRFLLNPTVVSHVRFNQLIYVTPDSDTPTTLWKRGEEIQSAPLTFALEGDLMRYRLSLGIRGRTFRPTASKADFDVAADQFIAVKQSASAIGTYLDVAVLRTSSKTERQFTLGLGFDYDISTVKIDGTKEGYEDGKTEELYRAKSTLTTIAGRLTIKLDWIFSSSILGMGLNLLVPISTSQSFSVNSNDNENRSKLPNPDRDLKDRLGHAADSYGAEAVLCYAIPF